MRFVVRLEQPSLGRRGRAHADRLERVESAGSIVLAEVEVDVVVGRWAAARPGREPATQHRRHAGFVESGAGALHRVDQLGQILTRCVSHGGVVPRRGVRGTFSGVSRWYGRDADQAAAAADLHCAEPLRERTVRAFTGVQAEADLILLGGDLTTHGEPEQALVLADACRDLAVPVIAVLGNHDHHADRCAEVTAMLEDAGIIVLDRSHTVIEVERDRRRHRRLQGIRRRLPGAEITTSASHCSGGCTRRRATRWQPSRRASRRSPAATAGSCCSTTPRSPETLVGEPERIWAFLGSGRLAEPDRAHRPDLVLHGHAHHGSPEGLIGEVPVRNVAVHVIGADFALLRC